MRQILVGSMNILGGLCFLTAIIETLGKLVFDFPQIPYLTANIVGPFDYALAYAIALLATSWVLKKVWGIEDEDDRPAPAAPRQEETRPGSDEWRHGVS